MLEWHLNINVKFQVCKIGHLNNSEFYFTCSFACI
jgi:hypothetical protein